MEHLQILFENINEDKKEILIALLSDMGFDGFEEEDKNLKAFIPSIKFDEDLFNTIIKINNVEYSKSIIKEENWNQKWESDFEPVAVNHPVTNKPFVFIRADFHQPNPSFLHDISITPKMSFGTGHHATTHLMVAHMSEIDFKNKTVIDFGTGTGVLAILAEKLGADQVTGIDNDDWSINNATENLLVNNCEKIQLIKAETVPEAVKGQIILANINLNIIKENIFAITNAAETNAVFLFSGIMFHDEDKIVTTLNEARLNIESIYRSGDWLLLKAKN